MMQRTRTSALIALIGLSLLLVAVVAGCGSSSTANDNSTGVSQPSGLFPAFVGDKWGYIDKTGSWVIQPQ